MKKEYFQEESTMSHSTKRLKAVTTPARGARESATAGPAQTCTVVPAFGVEEVQAQNLEVADRYVNAPGIRALSELHTRS